VTFLHSLAKVPTTQSNLESETESKSPKEAHKLRLLTNWLSHSKTALDCKDPNLLFNPNLKGA